MTKTLLLAALTLLPNLQAKPGDDIYQKGYLGKEKSLDSIELQDGYRLQLVLADPDIKEPVAIAWDGNGALYVVEMRTYMQDADASGEQEPRSRISRHVDTNGDGIYDQHSVYIDDLVLPRMILPLDNRLMVGLTNTLDLWTYRDNDGDGKADEKKKIYNGGPRGGNMEHQPSGLIWNLDNWIYLTYEAKRYRFTNGKLEVQKLPRGGGQWGLGRDNAGRLYYSAAGGEKPAFYFQQPIAYGALDLPGQTEKNFNQVYPIDSVPDAQGGERRIGPNGGLNAFTGCAGQGIYRGDRLPADLKGDLIIPEPVGRLVRRTKVDRTNGKTVLRNAYPQSEFIRSRDINFRPLGATTSPDGAMMILDMHRGIIQQGTWTRPGSYLRKIIDKWGLAENTGHGRLYRLVHDGFKPDVQPHMLDESTAQLVTHLSHPNGWWRDTAQKLIILRPDRESVIPALEKLVTGGKSKFGRLHALWTLEGMGQLRPEIVAEALGDESSLVRTSAVRTAEPFFAKENPAVIKALITSSLRTGETDMEMVTQAYNSIAASGTISPVLLDFRNNIAANFADNQVIAALKKTQQVVLDEELAAKALEKQDARFAASMEHGKTIYRQLCFSCHGNDGKGAPMPGQKGEKLAPSFVHSPRVLGSGDSVVRTLLHGLTGKLDGRQYEGLMVSMANNDDQWIADLATYIRNSFGNKAPAIHPYQIAALRKQHAARKTPWTQEELEKLDPPVLVNQADWKLTASDGAGSLQAAIDHDPATRYTSNKAQHPGMWIQIKFPSETSLRKIILNTQASPRDFPAAYKVQTSADGKKWGKTLAQGKGDSPVTKIKLPAGTKTRFLRITQTGRKKGLYWSIHDLQVYGTAQ